MHRARKTNTAGAYTLNEYYMDGYYTDENKKYVQMDIRQMEIQGTDEWILDRWEQREADIHLLQFIFANVSDYL